MRERVEPELRAYLKELDEEGGRPFEEQTPEENRQGEDEFFESLLEGLPVPEMRSVEDRTIDAGGVGVPVRIYTPLSGTSPCPVIVFFHGGGWVIGSVENRDFRCRTIAAQTGSIVVSVDYRLAPEHPFPAAPEDCWAAAHWVSSNAPSFQGDPGRLAVMGDSAGGNLSAVVCLMARDRGGPNISRQFLIYPAVDLVGSNYQSYREFGEDHLLTAAAMEYFNNLYVGNPKERKNPLVSPLFADSCKNLPPAYVVTAECDVLRDEGKAYADKMERDGVDVTYTCFSGMIHGFFEMGGKSAKAESAGAEILSQIRNMMIS